MMKIQKKSLAYASNVLKSFDTYPLYEAVNEALIQKNVIPVEREYILSALQKESSKLRQISDEAKEWIDAVIDDLP